MPAQKKKCESSLPQIHVCETSSKFVAGAAFGMITWAKQHLESSLVSSYFVLQPVVTASVGGIGVVATLCLVVNGFSFGSE